MPRTFGFCSVDILARSKMTEKDGVEMEDEAVEPDRKMCRKKRMREEKKGERRRVVAARNEN